MLSGTGWDCGWNLLMASSSGLALFGCDKDSVPWLVGLQFLFWTNLWWTLKREAFPWGHSWLLQDGRVPPAAWACRREERVDSAHPRSLCQCHPTFAVRLSYRI